MSSGTVKVWFEDKGFGFITNNDGSGDAFVHRAALTDGQLLMAGAHVYFEAQYNAIKQKSTATKVVGASGGAPGGPRPGDVGNPAGNAAPMAAEQPTDNLFVSGLPLSMTEDSVKQIFGAYGAVISCKVLGANGKPDVAALVRMGTQDQAKWLVDNVDKNIPVGLTTPVNVRFAKSSNDKPGSSFGQAASSTGAAAPRYNPYGGASVPESWKSLMGGAAAPAPGAAPAAAAAPNPVPPLPGQLQPGVVKVWYEQRGMGFISPAAGGDDIFVHRTALVDGVGLVVGAAVHFESSWDARKGKAIAKVCKGAIGADGVMTDSPMAAAPLVAGSAQPTAELLPEGWESAWSSEHSRTYYFNRKSGENVWEKPSGPSV